MRSQVIEAVINQCFGKTLKAYGCSVSRVDRNVVTYVCGLAFIEFAYDASKSGEFTVLFRGHDDKEPAYEIWELVSLINETECKPVLRQVSSIDELASCLEGLGGQLELCLRSIISNDNLFADLRKFRSIQVSRSSYKRQVNLAMREADDAWRAGEYRVYLQATAPFLDSLPESYIQKYKYAMKKLG